MAPCPSEGPFLREPQPGQGYAIRRFGDLHLHDGRVGRGDFSGPQYRVLRENFAVYLGDKVILAGYILTPDLSAFNAPPGHKFYPLVLKSTHPAATPSIAAEFLEVMGGCRKPAALLP